MAPDLLFRSQERYEEIFDTDEGWMVFAAEVEVTGRILKLTNILIEPLETRNLRIGTEQLWKIRRELENRARQEGYTHLELVGVRLSGSNPNRAIHYERRLR